MKLSSWIENYFNGESFLSCFQLPPLKILLNHWLYSSYQELVKSVSESMHLYVFYIYFSLYLGTLFITMKTEFL